jgi:thioredoxin-dependent peroxiredoxin
MSTKGVNPFNQSTLLAVGSPAPDFELIDQTGRPVRLSELIRRSWVVLFFYPKDHSPICTSQVCAFRNAYEDFRYHGAEVLGISADDQESHRRFAEAHQLPFTLLSDPGNAVRTLYGVPKTFGVLPGRVTFVIDTEGVVRMAYPSQFNAKAHMEKALAMLRQNRWGQPAPTQPPPNS